MLTVQEEKDVQDDVTSADISLTGIGQQLNRFKVNEVNVNHENLNITVEKTVNEKRILKI